MVNGESPEQNKSPLSLVISEVLLGYFIGFLAIVTVVTHFSQIFHLSFKVYALIVFIALILFSIFSLLKSNFRQSIIVDKTTVGILFFIAITCASLALFSFRFDGDDTFYIPNVIYLLEHPQEPMSFEVHFFALEEGCTIQSYSWGTAMSFEYMQGVFAHIFKVKFFTLYYLVSPSIVGFLIPLALYFALSQLSEGTSKNIVLSVFFTLAILLLMGETHRTYGNFTLTRAYQGKALLFNVGIPFFIGTSIKFLRKPSIYGWGVLASISIAMVGTTVSSVPLLLLLAVVLFLSFLMTVDIRKQKWEHFVFYFSSLAYLGFYAIFLWLFSRDLLGIENPINEGWPTTFIGHLNFMINFQIPLTPIIVGVSSLLFMLLTKGNQRKLVFWWMIFLILLCLNPIVAPFYIRYLTSPNAYWRMFYIFPYSIVIGISIEKIIERVKKFAIPYQAVVGILVCIILVGANALPNSTSTFNYNNTFVIPPAYKLSTWEMEVVEDINLYVPEGPMLAPQELTGYIMMYNSKYPQFTRNINITPIWLQNCGYAESTVSRIWEASNFVSGDLEKKNEFYEFLSIEGSKTQSILIDERSYLFEDVDIQLEQYGFSNIEETGNYFILWKSTN